MKISENKKAEGWKHVVIKKSENKRADGVEACRKKIG